MIRGGGMPSYRHHNLGNMFVKFDIEFPTATPPLDDSSRSLLKTILGLPPTKPVAKPGRDVNGMDVDQDRLELDALSAPIPAGAHEEDVDLEEMDHSGQARANRMMEDDDEDGVPHGAERMQCASQ